MLKTIFNLIMLGQTYIMENVLKNYCVIVLKPSSRLIIEGGISVSECIFQYLKRINIEIVDTIVRQITREEYYNYQNTTEQDSKGCYLENEYILDIVKGSSTILLLKNTNSYLYPYESLPQFMNALKMNIRRTIGCTVDSGNYIHAPGSKESRLIEEEIICLKIFFPSFYETISKATLRYNSHTPNYTKQNQSFLQSQEFEPTTPPTIKINQTKSLSYEEEVIDVLRKELKIIEYNNKTLENLIIAKKTKKERMLISIISIDPQYSERNNPINMGDWERRKEYYIKSALMRYFPELKNCCDKNTPIQSIFEQLTMENLQAHYEEMAQEVKEIAEQEVKEIAEQKPKKKHKQDERIRE